MLLCFVFECIVNTLQIFKNVVDRVNPQSHTGHTPNETGKALGDMKC